ncbi:hypothetical protein SKAU_G00272360 [Synaphobranchus kaupii]|uniref:Uncharacterized protein n=1 Tax=Synaphobranchus kaupii TaxID=118154 RepID=A0A9Q1IQI6_SYNKA|nr:hypothetical protein SKAU_G00272360 [Synaphobranchus kaupii]
MKLMEFSSLAQGLSQRPVSPGPAARRNGPVRGSHGSRGPLGFCSTQPKGVTHCSIAGRTALELPSKQASE